MHTTTSIYTYAQSDRRCFEAGVLGEFCMETGEIGVVREIFDGGSWEGGKALGCVGDIIVVIIIRRRTCLAASARASPTMSPRPGGSPPGCFPRARPCQHTPGLIPPSCPGQLRALWVRCHVDVCFSPVGVCDANA